MLDVVEDPGESINSSAEVPDHVLMVRIQAGDTGAYSAFYERHAAITFAVAMRTLHSPVLAHEVVQDAFLAIWTRREKYVGARGSARGWLLAIVRHRAIDVVRRESRRRRHECAGDERLDRYDDTMEEQVIIREDADAIRGLLAGIPSKQRRAIELAYVDGLSQAEIAVRLQIPLGTVKGQTRLGLEKLRAGYPPPA